MFYSASHPGYKQFHVCSNIGTLANPFLLLWWTRTCSLNFSGRFSLNRCYSLSFFSAKFTVYSPPSTFWLANFALWIKYNNNVKNICIGECELMSLNTLTSTMEHTLCRVFASEWTRARAHTTQHNHIHIHIHMVTHTCMASPLGRTRGRGESAYTPNPFGPVLVNDSQQNCCQYTICIHCKAAAPAFLPEIKWKQKKRVLFANHFCWILGDMPIMFNLYIILVFWIEWMSFFLSFIICIDQ